MSEAITNVFKAIKAIQDKEGTNRGVGGNIPCPICGGTLHYSIAKVNGHIWGSCSTKNCVRWMQ